MDKLHQIRLLDQRKERLLNDLKLTDEAIRQLTLLMIQGATGRTHKEMLAWIKKNT